MGKYYHFVIFLSLVACGSSNIKNANKISAKKSIKETYYEEKDADTTYYEQGVAPIVLYAKDLQDLQIREIEIIDSITGMKYREAKEPISLSVRFNQSGIFNGFSLASHDEEGYWRDKWRVILDVSVNRNTEVGAFPEYVDSAKITFITSPQRDKDGITSSVLDNFQIAPFIGKHGYIYKDTIVNAYKDTLYSANVIKYNKNHASSEKIVYEIRKVIASDSLTETLYFIKELLDFPYEYQLERKIEVDLMHNDTISTKKYCYGVKTSSVYNKERIKEYDEGVKDSIDYIKNYYENTIYKDTIYNANRWLGIASENEVDNYYLINSIDKAYDNTVDELKIINDFFKESQVTYISKANFYINGQNGYNYLRDAYSKKIVTEASEFHDAKMDESVQKNVIPELPKKIIVQVSLTDFWFIQLID